MPGRLERCGSQDPQKCLLQFVHVDTPADQASTDVRQDWYFVSVVYTHSLVFRFDCLYGQEVDGSRTYQIALCVSFVMISEILHSDGSNGGSEAVQCT